MSVRAGQAIKIGGVTVRPKWNWSDEYLNEVRAANPSVISAPSGRTEQRRKFDQYVEFLASSRGISIEEAGTLAKERLAEQKLLKRSASVVSP